MRKKTIPRVYRVMGKWPALTAALCCAALYILLAGFAGRTVQILAKPQKHPVYSVDIPEKKVALGINCAWDNSDIERLLKILESYKIKASFFVVGDWCDRYPESVKLIHQSGHEIGSHSDSHADMTKLDRDGVLREIRQSSDKIEALTGQKPTLFRPPSGAYNNLVVELIEREGMYPIQWDCERIDTITTNKPTSLC